MSRRIAMAPLIGCLTIAMVTAGTSPAIAADVLRTPGSTQMLSPQEQATLLGLLGWVARLHLRVIMHEPLTHAECLDGHALTERTYGEWSDNLRAAARSMLIQLCEPEQ